MELLRDAGIEPDIVLYLEDTPTGEQICELASLLGVSVAALLRRSESKFREAADLPDLDDDQALAAWVARHPITLERPIVVHRDIGKAVIGRPPENVRELLDQ